MWSRLEEDRRVFGMLGGNTEIGFVIDRRIKVSGGCTMFKLKLMGYNLLFDSLGRW